MLSGARDEEEEEEDGQTWCPQGECDTTSGNHVYESESEASGSDFNEASKGAGGKNLGALSISRHSGMK
ncbi:hypothetical protein AXG93_1335s1420 [Marchantia polymorpha subsp. ruderalis]|uniref:Uncharacterized protein n=1 Tax=Marchantia polymorpha subsp. ruderalis TaxID=1480154 RepID=A0A176W6A3_MARPO|nr:hypothetical protein AXG93_1335s1420 [Marchantia polymorpha subsp. ruderalis]